VIVPGIDARADQAPLMTKPLPMSIAEAPQQCCRMCKKGKPCGDGCISAEGQCKKDQGCACSALQAVRDLRPAATTAAQRPKFRGFAAD
jgi:hypothetical protein